MHLLRQSCSWSSARIRSGDRVKQQGFVWQYRNVSERLPLPVSARPDPHEYGCRGGGPRG